MSSLFSDVGSAQSQRDEKYVAQMIALDKILTDWTDKRLSNQDALFHADKVMENIVAIGTVDGDHARSVLQSRGIDDQRRLNLQRDYQALKQQMGQRVPQYGDTGSRNRFSRTACC
mmetsp:Transcript_23606/g.42661  ORF Transcript_23606/g.42661 Transcript_23606/m.42661 type:complete len:116 (+) Transcript_23606:99-446(+)